MRDETYLQRILNYKQCECKKMDTVYHSVSEMGARASVLKRKGEGIKIKALVSAGQREHFQKSRQKALRKKGRDERGCLNYSFGDEER